jgi:hypothetical protein
MSTFRIQQSNRNPTKSTYSARDGRNTRRGQEDLMLPGHDK